MIIYMIFRFFQDTKDSARILFELLFKNGWYILEKVDDTKIEETITKLDKSYSELK